MTITKETQTNLGQPPIDKKQSITEESGTETFLPLDDDPLHIKGSADPSPTASGRISPQQQDLVLPKKNSPVVLVEGSRFVLAQDDGETTTLQTERAILKSEIEAENAIENFYNRLFNWQIECEKLKKQWKWKKPLVITFSTIFLLISSLVMGFTAATLIYMVFYLIPVALALLAPAVLLAPVTTFLAPIILGACLLGGIATTIIAFAISIKKTIKEATKKTDNAIKTYHKRKKAAADLLNLDQRTGLPQRAPVDIKIQKIYASLRKLEINKRAGTEINTNFALLKGSFAEALFPSIFIGTAGPSSASRPIPFFSQKGVSFGLTFVSVVGGILAFASTLASSFLTNKTNVINEEYRSLLIDAAKYMPTEKTQEQHEQSTAIQSNLATEEQKFKQRKIMSEFCLWDMSIRNGVIAAISVIAVSILLLHISFPVAGVVAGGILAGVVIGGLVGIGSYMLYKKAQNDTLNELKKERELLCSFVPGLQQTPQEKPSLLEKASLPVKKFFQYMGKHSGGLFAATILISLVFAVLALASPALLHIAAFGTAAAAIGSFAIGCGIGALLLIHNVSSLTILGYLNKKNENGNTKLARLVQQYHYPSSKPQSTMGGVVSTLQESTCSKVQVSPKPGEIFGPIKSLIKKLKHHTKNTQKKPESLDPGADFHITR